MAPRSSWPTRWNVFLPGSMPSVAIAAEKEDRDMERAPCVTRSPTVYEQAGQEHGRTIPLAAVDRRVRLRLPSTLSTQCLLPSLTPDTRSDWIASVHLGYGK